MPPATTQIARRRFTILLTVLVVEIGLACALFLYWRKPIALGYLVKNGNEYIVAWRERDDEYKSATYASLDQALKFAKDSLKLSEGHNPISDLQLEHLWLQDRFGGYVLLWKTNRLTLLHQLTFQKRTDAMYFADAFRRGAYTPSPFGHSVLLLPLQTN